MLLRILKVSGHSMEPLLKEKDLIFVSSIPFLFTNPKMGDVVIIENNGKMLVKRIAEIKKDKVRVAGDNKQDSLNIGLIDMSKVKAKLIVKF